MLVCSITVQYVCINFFNINITYFVLEFSPLHLAKRSLKRLIVQIRLIVDKTLFVFFTENNFYIVLEIVVLDYIHILSRSL